MKVTLTRITGDPVLAIEEAASNCYDSKPSQDGKILEHCVASGHTSVTEFCTFTFHIEGVSRSLLAQFTRHRHAGYAVRSQRYCNEDGFDYVLPPSIKKNPETKKLFDDFMSHSQEVYSKLQSHGIPNEDARFVLPNACETVMEVTINLRSLMNFMNERLCSCAQWEIRKLALEMKKQIIEQVPLFDKYLVPKCEKYGNKGYFCTESKKRSCGRHPLLTDIMEIYHNYIDIYNS